MQQGIVLFIQWLSGFEKEYNKLDTVAHVCNPSCSGGRDQEDHNSRPAQANSSPRAYLEK
jgi:hypothetical protein